MTAPACRPVAALSALVLGAGLALGGGAAAATRHHAVVRHHAAVRHDPVGVAPGTEPYSVQGQIERGCVPLCDRDTNPCDPFSFKRADGRCSSSNN